MREAANVRPGAPAAAAPDCTRGDACHPGWFCSVVGVGHRGREGAVFAEGERGEVRCVSDVRLTVAGDGSSVQAYHWATIYPDVVEKFVAICSSARTSPHNIWCVPFFSSFAFAASVTSGEARSALRRCAAWGTRPVVRMHVRRAVADGVRAVF